MEENGIAPPQYEKHYKIQKKFLGPRKKLGLGGWGGGGWSVCHGKYKMQIQTTSKLLR